MSNSRAVIIGAGPVGSIAAVFCATLLPQWQVQVYDHSHAVILGQNLQILNSTTDYIIRELTAMRQQLLLQDEQRIPAGIRDIISGNIAATIAFFKEHFKGLPASVSISTQQVGLLLLQHAKDLSEQNKTRLQALHLPIGWMGIDTSKSVTIDFLRILRDPESSEGSGVREDGVLEKLRAANYILAADGAQSKVRTEIFKEPEAEKEDLNYLLEITLNMRDRKKIAGGFFKAPVTPNFVKGMLHFWQQRSDGTATLRVLIEKKMYERLCEGNLALPRAQRANATLAKPYRRLIDLPPVLQDFCQKEIGDFIGFDAFKPGMLRIIAQPTHVYQAKDYHTRICRRFFMLMGDAAIGFSAQHGANIGFVNALLQHKAIFTHTYINNQQNANAEGQLFAALDTAQKETNTFYDKTVGQATVEHVKKYEHLIPATRGSSTADSTDWEAVPIPAYRELLKAIPRIEYEAGGVAKNPAYAVYAHWLHHVDALCIALRRTLQGQPRAAALQVLEQFTVEMTTYISAISNINEPNVGGKEASSRQYERNAMAAVAQYKTLHKLAENVLDAGKRLIRYEDTVAKYNAAIKQLNSDDAKQNDLKLRLTQLLRAMIEEAAPWNDSHQAVLQQFTSIADLVAAGPLQGDAARIAEIEKHLQVLQHCLFGNVPLSHKIKLLIGLTIGAIVGLLAGAAVTLCIGGIGAPIGMFIGAAAGLAVVGGITGMTTGLMQANYAKDQYAERKKAQEDDAIMRAINNAQQEVELDVNMSKPKRPG